MHLRKQFTPIFGISRDNLISGMTYIYSIKATYANNIQPIFGNVEIEAALPIAQHNFVIAPQIGVEYHTLFAFTFFSIEETDSSEASYRLFRKDCPSDPNSSYIPFTMKLKNTNSFSTILAPGLKSCNYQISIKLIISTEDNLNETSSTLIVFPDERDAKDKRIKSLIKELESVSCIYSLSQSLSLLHQISSGESLNNEDFISILAVLTKYDTTENESILSSLSSETQISFYEQLLQVLRVIINRSQEILSQDTIVIIVKKVKNYIEKAQNIYGGSKISETSLEVLDSICTYLLANTNAYSEEFKKKIYSEFINLINSFVDLKLMEIIPGGHTYHIITKNIAISIKSEYNRSFGMNETYINISNHSIYFSSGLHILYRNDSQKCEYSDCVISSILFSISFNPYINIKDNAIINATSLSNASVLNNTSNRQQIKRIYSELRNSSKLDTVVDKSKSYSKFLYFSFRVARYSYQSKQKLINTSIILGNQTFPYEIKVHIPITEIGDKESSSPKIPFLYFANTKSWSNSDCNLELASENRTIMYNSSNINKKVSERYALITCIPNNDYGQYLVLAIDSINMNSIIKALEKVESILTGKHIAPIIYSLGLFIFVLIIGYFLHILDNREILRLTEEVLLNYDPMSTRISQESPDILGKLAQFFVDIREVGYASLNKGTKISEGSPTSSKKRDPPMVFQHFPGGVVNFPPSPPSQEVKDQDELLNLKKQLSCGISQNEKAKILYASVALKRLSIEYIEDKNDFLKEKICGYIMVRINKL